MGSIPTEVKKVFFFTSCGSLIPFTRANAQWVINGSISTSELFSVPLRGDQAIEHNTENSDTLLLCKQT